jgi:endoglycosylceramidase
MLVRRAALIATVLMTAWLASAPGANAAAPAPRLPVGHAGRWITDAQGRVVILHGINMVYKLPPYYPAAVGFGDDDAAFLNHIGFNAVRVGVIWKAVEPMPGVFDDSYLSQIAQTVRTLADHGVMSLLDFHQDLLNEEFQGEGFPDWAIQDGGLPNPMLGFPVNYTANPALEYALDQFWANAPGPGGIGLQDRYATAWAHVAAYFKDDPSVLGYEILNEPFPGTAWEPCAAPGGCPSFDAELSAFYRRVDRAVRQVDPRTLIWYEPNSLFNFAFATNVSALGDPRAGFAFHDYCLSNEANGCSSHETVMTNAVAHVKNTGEALMMTEFGATNSASDLETVVSEADQQMIPWLEWAYCGCSDPTTAGPGNTQAIVVNPALPPSGSNLEPGTLDALVEPYPQVIAGTPTSWAYDRPTSTFTLKFADKRAAGGGAFGAGGWSQIATPPLVYPHGYAADATGAAIVSPSRSGHLQLLACPRASTVALTVKPGTGLRGSCEASLKLTVSPRRIRLGHATRVKVLVRAVLGSYRTPVGGATVAMDDHRARTNSSGVARLWVTLRAATARIRARKAGYQPGRALVTTRV